MAAFKGAVEEQAGTRVAKEQDDKLVRDIASEDARKARMQERAEEKAREAQERMMAAGRLEGWDLSNDANH